MATITAPDFRIRQIDWQLDRRAQINTSIAGQRRPVAAPWFGKWHARVEIASLVGTANYRLMRSFFVRCNGPVNKFKLYAVVENQNANSGVTVAATVAAGATSMTISGASTTLKEGQMVTVNDQLLVLTADQSGSTITFEPQLRAQATLGASIETKRPWAMVRLAGESAGWSVDPGPVFGASFDAEEAF